MTETLTQMRDRHYAEAMRKFAETEAAVAADPSHRARVRMDDRTIIDVERDPVLEMYVRAGTPPESKPAGYYTDRFGRTLPVSWKLLRVNRISFSRAMHDHAERDRLEVALQEAFPIE